MHIHKPITMGTRLLASVLIIFLTALIFASLHAVASEGPVPAPTPLSKQQDTKMQLSSLVTPASSNNLSITQPAQGNASRIKDIVNVEGVRDNLLVGYGLVVGLNGTGDKLNNAAFTEKSLVAFLERLGINTKGNTVKTKNVAAVTVTSSLPAFTRVGNRVDVTVSTMGDAQSLQGGVLLASPLLGADGEVYAVAQGQIAIGGFEAAGKSGSKISKGVPTNGYIPNGAIVEKEIASSLNGKESLNLSLKNPDISTAMRIAEAINRKLNSPMAAVLDPATVKLSIPYIYRDSIMTLLSEVEQIPVVPDYAAKVVVDEASGTIVMGENVKISTVAVAQGNLIVKISEQTGVSQPGAFAPDSAQTVAAPVSTVEVEEERGKKLAIVKGASLSELVTGLNALGVGPRDLITILQNIKAAGALQADIETR